MSDIPRRFGGISRLYGNANFEKLRDAHACVVGIGGVGCWTAEALARSGVGTITLIDMDEVCESNVNRQLHALDGTVGQLKIQAMATRMQAINPDIKVHQQMQFFTAKTAEALLAPGFDVVVDCIDPVTHKIALVLSCRDANIPCICVGSAGGRRDPSRIQVSDVGKAVHDPLLARMRKTLRQHHGFPRKERARFGIPCIFSDEPVKYPEDVACDPKDPDSSLRLDCETGYGTVTMVTGSFGFFAAALAVDAILDKTN